MGVIQFLLLIALVGFVVYLLTTYVPMPEPVRRAIIIIAVLIIVLWFLSLIGLLGFLNRPIQLR